MQLNKQIEKLFKPLIGQKAWRASVGWGSFVTLEFGRRRLYNHHYHGDWHLWLYQCQWSLTSNGRCLAHSESKRRVMELAIGNLQGTVLTGFSFNWRAKVSEFTFEDYLHLTCRPYADAAPDEDYWILFMPNRQAASLQESGLKYEASDMDKENARRSPLSQNKHEIELHIAESRPRKITLAD